MAGSDSCMLCLFVFFVLDLFCFSKVCNHNGNVEISSSTTGDAGGENRDGDAGGENRGDDANGDVFFFTSDRLGIGFKLVELVAR